MYGYGSYHNTNIKTSDPKKIILLLYEGVVKNLNEAINLLESHHAIEGSEKISKSLEILNFLRNGIDFPKGGEIAENLANLYDYIRDIVNEGLISKDTTKFQEAVSLMNTLLDGWRSVLSNATPPEIPATSEQRPRATS